MATGGQVDQKTAESLLRGLECPVCQEYFTEPRMLPCGHTLCLRPCLQQVAGSSPRVKCPECRTEHVVPESGVQWFPLNVTVVRQLETRPRDLVETDWLISECSICEKVEDLSECDQCELKFCNGCLEQHLQDVRDEIVKLSQNAKRRADDMLKTRGDNIVPGIEMSANGALLDIEVTTQQIVALVQTRADKLKTQVVLKRDKQIEVARRNLDEFRKTWANITDLSDTALRAAANKETSPKELIDLTEQLRTARASTERHCESESNQTLQVNFNVSLIADVLNNFQITTCNPTRENTNDNHDIATEYTPDTKPDKPGPPQPSVSTPFEHRATGGNSPPDTHDPPGSSVTEPVTPGCGGGTYPPPPHDPPHHGRGPGHHRGHLHPRGRHHGHHGRHHRPHHRC